MITKKETNQISLDTREVYKAPIMEIVEVMVEQGFQMSGVSYSNDPLKEIKR